MLLPAGTAMPSVPFCPFVSLILACCALGHVLSGFLLSWQMLGKLTVE